jgi:MFS family permease
MTGRIDFRSILSSHALTAGLLCVFLGAIDLTVIASILSTIIPDLGVNTADIDRYIWVVNGYLIAYVVAIPLVGRLSDVVGRQPAFFACLAIFAVGSIMCAGADTLPALILGRTLQGFGGGGLLPVTIALAGDVLPRSMRLAGIGLVSAIDTLGWVLGPTWGAVVVGVLPGVEAPWRWVFWLNLPFLAVALFAVIKGFPRHHRDTRAPVTSMIDLPGSILLAIALVSINLALASGGEIGAQAGTGLRALGGTPGGRTLPLGTAFEASDPSGCAIAPRTLRGDRHREFSGRLRADGGYGERPGHRCPRPGIRHGDPR